MYPVKTGMKLIYLHSSNKSIKHRASGTGQFLDFAAQKYSTKPQLKLCRLPRHYRVKRIMIEKAEMFELALKACPSFKPAWEEFLDDWMDDKELPLYLALGGLSRHISSLVETQQVSELTELFEVVERWLIEGSPYVKEAATIGLFEGLQGQSNATSIETYLLPESKKWWSKVNEFWENGTLIM